MTAGRLFRLALASALAASLTGGVAAMAGGSGTAAKAPAPLAEATDVNAMLDLESKIDDALAKARKILS